MQRKQLIWRIAPRELRAPRPNGREFFVQQPRAATIARGRSFAIRGSLILEVEMREERSARIRRFHRIRFTLCLDAGQRAGHSARMANNGSTRLARLAGSQAAAAVTSSRSSIVAASINGSRARTLPATNARR